MRTTRTLPPIFEDDTCLHQGTDRVMRAYWLAPRTTRSATVLALADARPTSHRPDDFPPSDLA